MLQYVCLDMQFVQKIRSSSNNIAYYKFISIIYIGFTSIVTLSTHQGCTGQKPLFWTQLIILAAIQDDLLLTQEMSLVYKIDVNT